MAGVNAWGVPRPDKRQENDRRNERGSMPKAWNDQEPQPWEAELLISWLSRLFVREAAFLWITLRRAARSRRFAAVRNSTCAFSKSPAWTASRTRRICPRMALLIARL